ncbi:MAG: GGDEF domain-containing protein [Alteromonadaceae bacterium]|nr:MAG: GGDEF domain-containing protein [Alteromonadaceae bacterium]
MEQNGKMLCRKIPYYKIACGLLYLLSLLGSIAVADTAPLKFKALNTPDIHSIGATRAIAQDHQGFMWFGGEAGLARFDGYSLKIFRPDPDDPSSFNGGLIFELLVDTQGRLWIATLSGLHRFDHEQESFVHYLHDTQNPRSLSNNNVTSLIETEAGDIWVGTEGGLNRFNPGTGKTPGDFDRYQHQAGELNSLSSSNVQSLSEGKQGVLWVGTADAGVTRFDPKAAFDLKANAYQHYRYDPSSPTSIRDNLVNALYQDPSGVLWMGSRKTGLIRFKADSQSDSFERHTGLDDIYVMDIIEDAHHNVWLATDGQGVIQFNHASKQFVHYQHQPNDPRSLQNNKLRTLFEDKEGNLWFGHFPSGVSMLDRYAMSFQNYRHEPDNPNSLSHSAVLAVLEDRQRNLWVGTENGLNYIDRKHDKIVRYQHDASDPGSLSGNAVLSLVEDQHGRIWAGTWAGGLSRLAPPFSEDQTNSFTHYRFDANKPRSLSEDNIWYILEDSDKQLWMSTDYSGLNRYNPGTDDFTRYIHQEDDSTSIGSNRIYALFEDSAERFWVGTGIGLDRMNQHAGTFEHYSGEYSGVKNNANSGSLKLNPNNIIVIREDSRGHLWVGTHGSGVSKVSLDKKTGKIRSVKYYWEKDGLANNIVTSIVEDAQGDMWFSGTNGLSRLESNGESFQRYTQQDGLPGNTFNRHTGLITANNELVFGSTEGLTIFNPETLFKNTRIPPIVLTNLQVLNKTVRAGQSPLNKAIGLSDHLTLKPEESVFSFEFAALNYLAPEKNEYAYKLVGFDADWNYVGTRRMATYTNLDPGEYVFRVKGSNNEGVWNEQGVSITIYILPPWWRTWWAYSVYIAVFFGMLGLIMYTLWHKKQAEYERQLNHRLLQVDKVKDAFLANTSHELRTPLNGIIGLSESLIDGAAGPLPSKAYDNLEMIVNSGKRLSTLVNDILDFSRLRDNTIVLNKTAVDIYAQSNFTIALLLPLVGTKPVALVNAVPKDLPPIFADESRVQQILYNLVGNAIKFTSEGSVTISATISEAVSETISVSKAPKILWISVADTGIGIAANKHKKIFNAFEQADGSVSRSYSGTGLGLAVSQQLVALHGGVIELNSGLGEGATFRFSLPLLSGLDKAQSKPKPVIVDAGSTIHTLAQNKSATTSTTLLENQQEPSTGKFHILVVDDEPINRQVLLNLLSMQGYRISQCASGQEALALIAGTSHSVDIILLDVMMPGLSGYEVCKTLRKTYSPNQLPIIFLTAKNQIDDLTEGFAAGGNDYVNKPVNKEELYSRVNTHLELLDIHRDLEQKVSQRTEQLQGSHERLENAYEHLKQTQMHLVQTEKMSSLGMLVAGVGHEINNPANYSYLAVYNLQEDLGIFQTFLFDLLDGDKELASAFNEHFDKFFGNITSAMDGNKRVQEIVANLRSFSRLDGGSKQTCQLGNGLLSTLKLVQSNFKDEVEFVCDIQDDPELECSPSELNQVFMNLMVNACQAMVSSSEKQRVLTIHMSREGSEVVIEFKDTGPGMPEEVRLRIFEPFFTTKPDGKGTGLGLSISFGIVERHEGRIEVKSEPGAGTVFRLCLPLKGEG